jgi:hypothetical protein
MILVFVVFLLVVMLLGSLPIWPYSTRWGYWPSGVGTALLLLLAVWLIVGGHIRF